MFTLLQLRNKRVHDKTIPVIIPHFRAPETLRQTVLHAQTQSGVKVEIFVRDNSQDNILFTHAVNEGLSKYCFNGQHDYVAVLNHDALMRPDCLAQVISAMQAHPKVGIGCPIQLSAANEPTWFGSLQAFPTGVHAGGSLDPLPDPFATYWANGACMVLRTAMVREIGLMDKNMRFICSDSDYSFTARSRGWDILVVPSAQVEHALGGSGQIGSDWLETIKLQDLRYFAHKWLSGDLYRNLSMEGAQMDAVTVKFEIEKIESALQHYSAMALR